MKTDTEGFAYSSCSLANPRQQSGAMLRILKRVFYGRGVFSRLFLFWYLLGGGCWTEGKIGGNVAV